VQSLLPLRQWQNRSAGGHSEYPSQDWDTALCRHASLALCLGWIHEHIALTGVRRWWEPLSPNYSSLGAGASATLPDYLVLP